MRWRFDSGRSLRAAEKAAGEMGNVAEDILREILASLGTLCRFRVKK